MKILLALDSSKYNDYFAIRFVTEGIEPYKTTDVDEILPIIEEKNISVLLLDFDSKHYKAYDTIKEIKTLFNQVVIILTTLKTGIEFAKRTMELGVFGLINKTDDIETQFRNIIMMIDNLSSRKQEKRRHMRVKPATYQHNSFILRIPGLPDEYKGVINDISLGGVAATLDQEPSDSLLFKGKEINIEIELGFITVQTKALLVLKKGRDMAMLFKDLKESQRKRICEYVISRLG